MGTGGSPSGAAIVMGVPMGFASGRGAELGFSLQELRMRLKAASVRIKMAVRERMRVALQGDFADLCRD
jgi:hypothetical protein